MLDSDTEGIKEALRAVGLRAMKSRVATLTLLYSASAPLTHAEVSEHLALVGFDKSTAFRNLNDMANAGLLRRVQLGDHVWRFEPAGQCQHANAHPHFLCVSCGSISCLKEIQLAEISWAQGEQLGEVTEILIRGNCINCV